MCRLEHSNAGIPDSLHLGQLHAVISAAVQEALLHAKNNDSTVRGMVCSAVTEALSKHPDRFDVREAHTPHYYPPSPRVGWPLSDSHRTQQHSHVCEEHVRQCSGNSASSLTWQMTLLEQVRALGLGTTDAPESLFHSRNCNKFHSHGYSPNLQKTSQSDIVLPPCNSQARSMQSSVTTTYNTQHDTYVYASGYPDQTSIARQCQSTATRCAHPSAPAILEALHPASSCKGRVLNMPNSKSGARLLLDLHGSLQMLETSPRTPFLAGALGEGVENTSVDLQVVQFEGMIPPLRSQANSTRDGLPWKMPSIRKSISGKSASGTDDANDVDLVRFGHWAARLPTTWATLLHSFFVLHIELNPPNLCQNMMLLQLHTGSVNYVINIQVLFDILEPSIVQTCPMYEIQTKVPAL